MTVTLGPLDSGYVEALAAARFRELLGPDLEPMVAMQVRAQHTSWQEQYGESGHLVVLLDGLPVGRLWTAPDGDATRIVDLLIDASARGQGVGHELVALLLATGRPLTASVVLDDNLARTFWAREGFVSLRTDGVRLELRHEGKPDAGVLDALRARILLDPLLEERLVVLDDAEEFAAAVAHETGLPAAQVLAALRNDTGGSWR